MYWWLYGTRRRTMLGLLLLVIYYHTSSVLFTLETCITSPFFLYLSENGNCNAISNYHSIFSDGLFQVILHYKHPSQHHLRLYLRVDFTLFVLTPLTFSKACPSPSYVHSSSNSIAYCILSTKNVYLKIKINCSIKHDEVW